MKKMFDKKDLEIISCLRQNSRQSLKDISKVVGLPISTIYDRLKKLEDNKLILKYTILLNFKQMAYPIKSAIFFKVTNGERKKLEDAVFGSMFTNKLVKLTGDEYTYFFEGIFPNMDKMCGFVDYLQTVCKIDSHKVYYIVDDIKNEGFLQNKNDASVINE
jgi:DNA-binding Lrp family transcriptional regulator